MLIGKMPTMFLFKIFYLLALLLILVPLIISTPTHHDLHKRSSFFDIECKGVFNKSIFFRLDRICEDCYALFREPQLHSLCKENCYSTEYFRACVEALNLEEEWEKFERYREIIGK